MTTDAPAALRAHFEDHFLLALGAPEPSDVDRVESLFGRALRGPLRQLIERRGGEVDLELGPFMVFSAQDAYTRDRERFEEVPFEAVLPESWLLHALFSDAVPIGQDGAGQMYFAHLDEPSEIALYDPGQGAVRFLAADLPTFVYLAKLGDDAWKLIDDLDLDDPEDADPSDPALQPLKSDLDLVADRVNLCDEIVATDFDEPLTGMTGLEPAYRPEPSAIEVLHDRADWLLQVLGMGYDVVDVDELDDTFDEERGDPDSWSSAAVRLYWLWRAFVLGEDARLDGLLHDLTNDPALWVRDSVRLARSLRSVTDPEEVPEALRDLVRSRQALSLLWTRHQSPMQLELPPPAEEGLPAEHVRRTEFLANEGYCRGRSAFTEEARECVASVHHGDATLFAHLVPLLDRPPSGGKSDGRFNLVGAGLLPYDAAPECKAALLGALSYRSADLSHLAILPGVVLAMGRLRATECVPDLVQLLDEFAVVWQYGYAKAGDPAVLEAVCEALAQLEDDRSVDALIALACRDSDVDASLPLRQQAIVALAHTSWDPPEQNILDWTRGGEREAAQYLLARRGRSLLVDENLAPMPSTAFSILCDALATERAPDAVDVAELALRTVHKTPFVTHLLHVVALEVLGQALPMPDERSAAVLMRVVRFALVEEVRRRAIELVREHDPSFQPTFCDRPTVDAAFEQDGARGLASLLEAPCPVYRHNVFKKAGEVGAREAVVDHLAAFAEDLGSYRHRWAGSLDYSFETQYYAAIDCLHALGARSAWGALDAVWRAGMIGRERVEYVLGNLGFRGFARFEKRIARIGTLEATGREAYGAKQYAEAAKSFRSVLRINPGIAAAWRNLGHSQIEEGRPKQALTSYERATEIEPDNALGWYYVSQALYRLERWEHMITATRQGLATDPDSVRCRFNLALAMQGLDRYDEAMAQFETLLAADLSGEAWMPANIHLNRAILHAVQGHETDAVDSLQASLAADPAYLDHALGASELVAALGAERIRRCAGGGS